MPKNKSKLVSKKRKMKGSGPNKLEDGDIVTLTFKMLNTPHTIKKIDHTPASKENNKVYIIDYKDNISQNSLWIYRKSIKSVTDGEPHRNINSSILQYTTKQTSPTLDEIIKPRSYNSHHIRTNSRTTSRQRGKTIEAKLTPLQRIPESKHKPYELFDHYFEVCDYNNHDKTTQYLKIDNDRLTVSNQITSIPIKNNKFELCITSANYLKKCATDLLHIDINIQKINIDDNSLYTLEKYRSEKSTKMNIYEYAMFRELYTKDISSFILKLQKIPIPYYANNGMEFESKYILYHPGGMDIMSPITLLSKLPDLSKLFCFNKDIQTLKTQPFTIFFHKYVLGKVELKVEDDVLDVYEFIDESALNSFFNDPNKTKSLSRFIYNNKGTLHDENFNVHLKTRNHSIPVATLFDYIRDSKQFSLDVNNKYISKSKVQSQPITLSSEIKLKVLFEKAINDTEKLHIKDPSIAISILDKYITKYKLCSCTI
jgi:hypothetical protein